MRKLIATMAAVPLVALGCSDPAGPPDPGASGPLTGSISVQAAGGEGEIGALRELVQAFERDHPGTEVELVPIPSQGDHVAKLTTAFAAGNPPDVFLLNYRRLGQFAKRGVVDPVTGLDPAGFYRQTLGAFTLDGKLMCVPQNASNPVVYVNVEMFRRAGVALPKPGWTFRSLELTAAELAGAGVQAIGYDPSLIRVAPLAWSAGGEIVDDPARPAKVDLANPGARKAVELLIRLQQYGLDATERAAQEPEERFLAGRLAMFVDSRRAVPSLRRAADLKFDVVGLPRDREPASVLHSDGYCVAAKSDNRRLARAFARYAVSDRGGRILARTGRTVPSRETLATSPDFLDPSRQPKSSQVFLDAIPHARAMPSVPGWDEAEEAADELLAQLFAGRLSYDDAASRIAEETERILARRR